MVNDLILGTAGHIDHGKSSLIRALTGVDPDRLPEEKRRGITIELGYADLQLGPFHLGIVDVPGHERFVRQMLSGATGMDLAMLVVAADDSVKPQTLEHLDVLRLLNLSAGVIALTKCDIASEEWTSLVAEEVRDLTSDSFLQDAPIVRTSSRTGAGLDELRAALQEAAAAAAKRITDRDYQAPFRMAVDRVFTMAGHGTVVTGSVASGQTAVGDQLQLQPGQVEVRVRGLQTHDQLTDEIHRGQRAAINLVGVPHHQLQRGQELAAPGHLRTSRILTAEISLLPNARRPLKNRQTVRLHVGTAEILSRVSLLGTDQVAPGDQAFVQFFLRGEAATVWGQPYVLRTESPVMTIGGGRVLVPTAERITRWTSTVERQLRAISEGNERSRAAAACYFSGKAGAQVDQLPRTAGQPADPRVIQDLLAGEELVPFALSRYSDRLLHRDVVEELAEPVLAALRYLHDRQPLAVAIDRGRLHQRLAYLAGPELLDALLRELAKTKKVQWKANKIQLAGHGPQLSKNETQLLQRLVDTFEAADLRPPTVKQCRQEAGRLDKAVPQLLEIAVAQGDLVPVSESLFLHVAGERKLREALRSAVATGEGVTISQIREILETSRKYAVPFCEYLDRIEFTRRKGDLRFLNP